MNVRRIGILTGGGDCPGLNAVIRAVSKKAIMEYGIKVVGIKDGYQGLIENMTRKLSVSDVSGILTLGGTILGTSNKADPFRYARKVGKKIVLGDLSARVKRNYQALNLDCLVCIGGDGTLSVASRLSQLGLNIIGIPKTIDNDLSETDMTFGFDTAVANATEAIDKIHTTAQSHHRVLVVETMGRYAGWIALTAGIAGGGDIIIIPEIPFDIKKVCQKVRERNRRGKRFSIIIVAEGAHPQGGEMMVNRIVSDSPDTVRLGGISRRLADAVEKMTGIETRVTILGHIQRGGTPTAYDRVLATRFGAAAVDLIVKRQFDSMVALKGNRIKAVPIKRAVRKLKLVPLDSPLIAAVRSVGVSFGD